MGAGFMAFWKGEDDRAFSLFGRALEIGRRLGDLPLVSRALSGLARVALRSDVAEARRLARESLAVSEEAADVAGRSNAMHLLGVGAQIAGDLLEAREWMTRRLALVRELNNEALISSEACNLSMVERQLGNLDAAETLAREAMEIAERRGDEFMKPFGFLMWADSTRSELPALMRVETPLIAISYSTNFGPCTIGHVQASVPHGPPTVPDISVAIAFAGDHRRARRPELQGQP